MVQLPSPGGICPIVCWVLCPTIKNRRAFLLGQTESNMGPMGINMGLLPTFIPMIHLIWVHKIQRLVWPQGPHLKTPQYVWFTIAELERPYCTSMRGPCILWNCLRKTFSSRLPKTDAWKLYTIWKSDLWNSIIAYYLNINFCHWALAKSTGIRKMYIQFTCLWVRRPLIVMYTWVTIFICMVCVLKWI